MIEKLYHTESYVEPHNSTIKKVNEIIDALNSGTQPASTNSAMDAIATLRDTFDSLGFGPDGLMYNALNEMETVLQQHQ